MALGGGGAVGGRPLLRLLEVGVETLLESVVDQARSLGGGYRIPVRRQRDGGIPAARRDDERDGTATFQAFREDRPVGGELRGRDGRKRTVIETNGRPQVMDVDDRTPDGGQRALPPSSGAEVGRGVPRTKISSSCGPTSCSRSWISGTAPPGSARRRISRR